MFAGAFGQRLAAVIGCPHHQKGATAAALRRPRLAVSRNLAHSGTLGILGGHSPKTSWETPCGCGRVAQPGRVATTWGRRPSPLRGRRSCLQRAGFNAPTWHQLIESARPEEPAVHNFGDPLRGWQRAATASLDAAACESLLSDLDPASRALLLSQVGPGGSRAITALPTSPELRMPSECMRVVLLRRLRLPLPHAPRQCRCGGIPPH